MSDPPEPAWHLLPRDSEKFFGLEAGYDRKDLKRAYNQFVKRFKPERFPNEFQRIRAAYDSLQDALRYDIASSQGEGEPEMPSRFTERVAFLTAPPPATVQSPAPVEPRAAATTPPSLEERLAQTSPEHLYRELRESSQKSPRDYLALALLADAVNEDRRADESFGEWLLQGLAAHPGNWDLAQLLREYLTAVTAIDTLLTLLPRCAATVRDDRLHYITERAWDRLLREATFEQFRICLEQCHLLSHQLNHNQLAFQLHILRLAMWKADDDFLDSLREPLEDHFFDLDGAAQADYELLSALLTYRSHRDEFVKRGSVAQRIDQAIQDWCLQDEPQGDQSVLDCQHFLNRHGQRLLEAFPDPNEVLDWLLIPWETIVADVEERLDDEQPHDDQEVIRHTRDFLIRLNRRTKRTTRHMIGLTLIAADLAFGLGAIVISCALLIRMLRKMVIDGRWLGALGDGVLATFIFVVAAVVFLIVILIGRRKSQMQYQAIRAHLFTLLRVTPVRIGELKQIITSLEDAKYGDDESVDDTEIVARALDRDPAMQLFNLAQLTLSRAAREEIVVAQLL